MCSENRQSMSSTLGRTLQSCTTAKGHSCVMRKAPATMQAPNSRWQFEDVLYLGMSDELPEPLMVLELLVLRDFIHLFGFPQLSAQVRKSQWKRVGQLMKVFLSHLLRNHHIQTYEELLKNEQPFLFQGLEYISYSYWYALVTHKYSATIGKSSQQCSHRLSWP